MVRLAGVDLDRPVPRDLVGRAGDDQTASVAPFSQQPGQSLSHTGRVGEDQPADRSPRPAGWWLRVRGGSGYPRDFIKLGVDLGGSRCELRSGSIDPVPRPLERVGRQDDSASPVVVVEPCPVHVDPQEVEVTERLEDLSPLAPSSAQRRQPTPRRVVGRTAASKTEESRLWTDLHKDAMATPEER